MKRQKRILICPLDWGLGHATRCIPIINELLKNKFSVIIAASGRSSELLKQEFPKLGFVDLKGYDVTYNEWGSQVWQMLKQVPKILGGIKREHAYVEQIIDQHKIDCVISDNRYGCWSSKAYSVFITHQLCVKAPYFERFINKKIKGYIGKYNECWLPDFESEAQSLGADLVHKFELPDKVSFLGPLTRFTAKKSVVKSIDILAIVSGPEPQRTIFFDTIMEQLEKTKLQALVVCGTPEEKINMNSGTIKVVSHLESKKLEHAVLKSKLVVSRSGYSTIMDLSVLGSKAFFVPTPGQTEQEYLAKEFHKKGIAFTQKQHEFNLLEGIKQSEKFSGFESIPSGNLLKQKITELEKNL